MGTESWFEILDGRNTVIRTFITKSNLAVGWLLALDPSDGPWPEWKLLNGAKWPRGIGTHTSPVRRVLRRLDSWQVLAEGNEALARYLTGVRPLREAIEKGGQRGMVRMNWVLYMAYGTQATSPLLRRWRSLVESRRDKDPSRASRRLRNLVLDQWYVDVYDLEKGAATGKLALPAFALDLLYELVMCGWGELDDSRAARQEALKLVLERTRTA